MRHGHVALSATAQPSDSQIRTVPTIAAASLPGSAQRHDVAADVGTGWNILQIPAAAFTITHGQPIPPPTIDPTLGYIRAAALDKTQWWAPVQLPSGAGIGFLDIYAFGNVTATLRRYGGYGVSGCSPFCPPNPPSSSNVVSVSSTNAAGVYRYLSSGELSPLHTVSNDVVFGGGAQYVVLVEMPAGLPAPTGVINGFKGVDIWWKRQISPAPATATFTDVPVGAQFFAEIEALAESGITLGCTPTTFCPEANLTRRQMAAFLARALGLYFQY